LREGSDSFGVQLLPGAQEYAPVSFPPKGGQADQERQKKAAGKAAGQDQKGKIAQVHSCEWRKR
jgi:hypothetical protein